MIEPERKHKEKMQKPGRFSVLFNFHGAYVTDCHVYILEDVFGMSRKTALTHAEEAEKKSVSVVFEGTAELAEMKAQQAQNQTIEHANHNPTMAQTHFTWEPSQ